MSKTSTIIITALITTVIVGSAACQRSPELSPTEDTTTQESEEISTITTPQFDTLEKYLIYSVEDTDANKIKSNSKPDGLTRIQAGSGDLSIAPDGIDFFNAHVWATSNWDEGKLEDLQTFYIETIQFDLTKEEEGIDITETAYSTWYGPFQGKLIQLAQ